MIRDEIQHLRELSHLVTAELSKKMVEEEKKEDESDDPYEFLHQATAVKATDMTID